jgi:parvulin-like peptidyl-prolyl isomerase
MPKNRKQRVIVPHQMTRGQLSRHERELRQQRILYYAMAGVVGLILLVFGMTALNEYVLKPARLGESLKAVVATVGNEQITRGTYNKLRSWDLFNQLRIQAFYQAQGVSQSDTTQIQALQQQLANVATEPLDATTLQTLAENTLLAQQASTVGVTVTDDDVKADALKQFEPQPTPIPGSPTVAPSATATPATPPPTPTSTPQTPVPTATSTATFTDTPGPSPTRTSTPTVTNTPLPVPGAQQTATVDYSQFVNAIQKGPQAISGDPFCDLGCPGMTEQDYLNLVAKPDLLRKKVTEKLQADLETSPEQVHVAHILFMVKSDQNPTGTHTDAEALQLAQQTLDRLNKGEDFAKLAAELSEDTSNKDKGGDLGWFLPTEKGGPMVQDFSTAAYKLTKPGELSPPVKTQFGYHIIKLIERGPHDLDPTAFQQLKDNALTKWLDEQKTKVTYQLSLPTTPVPPTTVALPTSPPPPAVTNPPITNTNPVTTTGTITK